MITTVKFAKIREDAKIPSKRLEDAGYDIYPCFDADQIIIQPNQTTMIPTGIASACDVGFCFILKERGSTGIKGIAQRSGVIDSGYRGEWSIPITNVNSKPLIIAKSTSEMIKNMSVSILGKYCTIHPYEKALCQALVIPVPEVEVEEYTYDELKKIPSERGSGRLGSSGK